MQMWERWQNRHHPERQAFYRIKGWQRVVVAVVYLGLAVALGIAADLSHLQRDISVPGDESPGRPAAPRAQGDRPRRVGTAIADEFRARLRGRRVDRRPAA